MNRYHDQPRPPWSRDWNRPPIPSDTMRVSNAERAEVTDALCRHLGDGRLDEAEFNDRLARATAAKTQADLAPLLADLPRIDSGPPTPRSETSRAERSRKLTWVVLGIVALLAIGWSGSFVAFPYPHVPWVLVAIVVFVLVRRQRWRGRHHDRV